MERISNKSVYVQIISDRWMAGRRNVDACDIYRVMEIED